MHAYPEIPEIRQNLLYNLLKLILFELQKSGSKPINRPAELYNKMLNYLHENYATTQDRQIISSVFKVSTSYVSALFRKYGNTSFNYMLNEIRCENACNFLKQTSMTLDEISELCGFAYTSYFIRVFRQHRNMSPGEYRL